MLIPYLKMIEIDVISQQYLTTKLTNLINLANFDSITFNKDSTTDDEVSNKKYFDDELKENTKLRFNQTLENYLKVSAGNDVYNLTEHDEKQIIDATIIKYPNSGGYHNNGT